MENTEYFDIFNEHTKDVRGALAEIDPVNVQKAAALLAKARDIGHKVLVFGNGGSAATSSHFANDLTKMCSIPTISVPDMVPLMTAHCNDDGYDSMFSEIVKAFYRPGDVLVGISCSGNSNNVVEALKLGDQRIIMTGDKIGKVYECQPAIFLEAMNPDIRVQEDIHMIMCHAIARIIDGEMPIQKPKILQDG